MILSEQLHLNAAKILNLPAISYLGQDVSYQNLLKSISKLSYLLQNELETLISKPIQNNKDKTQKSIPKPTSSIGNMQNFIPSVRVAYVCRNTPAIFSTFFAITNIRGLNIPINPDLPPETILECIKESNATHIAVTNDLITHVKTILNSENLQIPLIEIEKKHGGEYAASFTPPPEHSPQESDTILMLRTSGTTGKPKYTVFSHRQVLNALQILKNAYHIKNTDRFLTSLSWSDPFAFLHGFFLPIFSGATCTLDHGLQNLEWVQFLTQARITRLIAIPAIFDKLKIICTNENCSIPSVKSITIGRGLITQGNQQLYSFSDIPIAHCYGQTENLWTLSMQDTVTPEAVEQKTYNKTTDTSTSKKSQKIFFGYALPGLKYKVVDQAGDAIEGNKKRIGHLAISGATVMQGYYQKEKETKMTLRGSWLYTGDIVELVEENQNVSLYFIGRKEDLIEVQNTYTSLKQADTFIKTLPIIEDGAAFAIKTLRDILIVACVIIKKPDTPVTETQILDLCKLSLPSYLIPKKVFFTDYIPRDKGNNVNATKLRSQFSGLIG